ncbi:ABC transporter ATP-binding protein [Tenacibaculum maritimum]|uniref:peptidase domain-containing ABC transporter n=1 Tax=Tenacibaculum maritimum TaxID=107401 RepID=UPI0012E4F394|nr:peptidase domain-containing ABC transporter [Tenacibaculum maritimum]CAA0230756.1 ABC transporter ATP-binding protein [Tenacibaculum maritimum]
MKSKFPFYKQLDLKDCGPTCLKIIAKFYGKIYSIDFLREKAHITQQGSSYGGIAEAAEIIGMHSLGANITYNTLAKEAPLPCIAHWRQRHFVVVYKIDKDQVYISDPAHGLIKYTKDEFLDGWIPNKQKQSNSEGSVLLLEPTPEFYKNEDDTTSKKLGFKFLFPYFKKYKKILIQLFLGLFIVTLLQLAMPFLTQAVVDYGINYQNLNFVYLILIAQLVFFISTTSVQIIRDWLMLHMTGRINIRLLSDFLMKLMKLPILFFDRKNIGDLLQRIQDHTRIQNFLSSSTLGVLFSFVNIFVFSLILAYYNMLIFSVFSLGTLLYLGWTIIFLKKRKELDYKRFDLASGNQSSVVQLLNGMQEIKLNGSERRRRWEWETIQARLYKVSIKSLALQQTQNIGGSFINQLKNIIITFLAAKSVINGDLTLGAMLSVQYILGQLNVPVNSLITFVQSAQDTQISLARISDVHLQKDEENKISDSVKQLPNNKSIYLNDLSFRYGSKHSPLVLENINLEIPESKVTAIVGASGSGKTTLLKHLLRIIDPTKGNIKVGNTSLNNLSISYWRSKCGSVMQEGYIFSDTIVRNITESDSEGLIDKERLLQSVKIANIESFIESLPMGYNTRIGASGMGISGGQKQRILIARAIYKNPDYLFFDEATSALDSTNESEIMKKLDLFFKNRTVVVVAHRLSTVKKADKIIVLEKGKIIEQGNHQELVCKRGVYYRLVKDQLELGN